MEKENWNLIIFIHFIASKTTKPLIYKRVKEIEKSTMMRKENKKNVI